LFYQDLINFKYYTGTNKLKTEHDGDVLSYDPGSLIMEWKSEFDLDKTPSKLEKFKFWKNRSEVGEGTFFFHRCLK
jgi:hypothetical protein